MEEMGKSGERFQGMGEILRCSAVKPGEVRATAGLRAQDDGCEHGGRVGLVVAAAAVVLAVGGYAAFGSVGCTEVGATDNQEQVGRQERGRDPGDYETEMYWDAKLGKYVWLYQLFYSDVILSPDGANLMAMVPAPGPDEGFLDPSMFLAVAPLPVGDVKFFPDMRNLERINFSPDGATAFLLHEGGTALSLLDLGTLNVSSTIELDSPFGVVDVAAEGRFLVLSNLPTTDAQELWYNAGDCTPAYLADMPEGATLCEVGFIDLETNEQWTLDLDFAIRDIDFSTVAPEILLTWSRWIGQTPLATVEFYDMEKRQVSSKVDFQNCADELVIADEESLAILAPTTCSRDPISIIDLETRSFVKTLPGFGPVVVARDGSAAVGFTRKQDMETQWGYHGQTTDFGLIIVNLHTLDWKVLDHGKVAPAYTVSPDGKYLYVFHETLETQETADGTYKTVKEFSNFQQVSLADFSTVSLEPSGLGLDHFVWTGDGLTMFFTSGSRLYSLDAGIPQVHEVSLGGLSPELLNIRPQGDFLVLGEYDAPMFYLVTLDETHAVTQMPLKYDR